MQIDFLNPRSIICLIAVLQGLVFAALLVARGRRRKNRADFYLASLLLLLCLALVTPLIGFANVYDLNQWLTYFPFTVAYGHGVCVWLYVVHLTDSKRRLSRRDLSLFLPSALYLAVRFALFAQSLEFKDWFHDRFDPLLGAFVFVTEFAWNTALLYASISHYRKYRVWLDDNYSDTERLKFDWLRNFLYLFSAVFIVGALFDFVDSFLFRLSYIQYFYFEIVLALVTYYLAVAGYLRSHSIELEYPSAAPAPSPGTRRAALPEKEFEKLKARLERLMRDERPHLEPTLTLADLAKTLGVNAGALSYMINHGFGINFNDFVNELRIREVKRRLAAGAAEKQTLLAIALECGFNSKATFNRAFKKFTGVAPKDFQPE